MFNGNGIGGDSYVENAGEGFFTRIKNALAGVLFGIVLFFGSFGVLYWNEGRVDLGEVAKNSVAMAASKKNHDQLGKFVAAEGEMKASGKGLGDKKFMKKRAGKFLVMSRYVEMYAWKESSRTEGKKNNKRRIYSYKKEWTSSPENSSSFKKREGHDNPELWVTGKTIKPKKIFIGVHKVDVANLSLSPNKSLSLDRSLIKLSSFKNSRIDGNSIYLPYKGRHGSDNIGDIRVTYKVIDSPQKGVLLGKLTSTGIGKYFDEEKGVSLFRFFPGLDRVEAIATLKSEHNTMTWILRAVGFFMMWIGMVLFFGPITTLLDSIPFFGGIFGGLSGMFFGVVTFIIAAILTPITIIISIVAHNIFLMVGFGLLFVMVLLGGVGKFAGGGHRSRV